jgi:hypothetical protein
MASEDYPQGDAAAPPPAGGYQPSPGQPQGYPAGGYQPSPGQPQGYPAGSVNYPPGGAGYPPGGAGYPPPGTALVSRHGAGMATASLVLGILALITGITVIGGVVLGLLALIFGVIAARRARREGAPGRGRAVAGIVTGVLGIILAVALIVAGASLLNSKAGKNLQSCLQNAGSNQAAVQRCDQQFANHLG